MKYPVTTLSNTIDHFRLSLKITSPNLRIFPPKPKSVIGTTVKPEPVRPTQQYNAFPMHIEKPPTQNGGTAIKEKTMSSLTTLTNTMSRWVTNLRYGVMNAGFQQKPRDPPNSSDPNISSSQVTTIPKIYGKMTPPLDLYYDGTKYYTSYHSMKEYLEPLTKK